MAILLLFNEFDRITVGEILETVEGTSDATVEGTSDETQIKSELCIQSLFILLKMKVLTCPRINPDQIDSDLKEIDILDFIIQVDESFKRFKNLYFIENFHFSSFYF